MKELIQRIKAFSENQVTFENLGEFVKSIDFSSLEYEDLIPRECAPGDYGRNILTLEPFECVLIYWPPGIESAIHYHEGFFGYVAVLKGELDNVVYEEKDGLLKETQIIRCFPNGVIDEFDGVIHKLTNTNQSEDAISLHFYYPALETLEDLAIYNTDLGAVGVLSDQAPAASWSEKPGHFKSIKKDVYTFVNFEQYHQNHSHVMFPILPKPPVRTIQRMVSNYYCEQADEYDIFDVNHPTRKAYTNRVNQLVAEDLFGVDSAEQVLHIAMGTGRRAIDIKQKSEKDYQITGVDISAKMCAVASERGIEVINASWDKAELPEGVQYDAMAWLYGFGHICSHSGRVEALRKIQAHLKPGGAFYFDVFNLHNHNEWGPRALKAFHNLNLASAGYEKGDVFYKRTKGNEIAFVHYFEKEELEKLLAEAGMKMEKLITIGYVQDSGAIKTNRNEGFFFIKAVKA